MGRETYDSHAKDDRIDWITILFLLLLSSFGLFLLSTLSQEVFFQQLLFVAFGALLLWVFSRLDSALLWWFAPWAYVGSILLLLLTYLGPEIRGATRWIVIGGMQVQPSELVKPFLLLAFSRFITEYSPRNLRYVALHIVLFLLPTILVIRQPDIGTSLIYISSWVAMMLAGGLPVLTLLVSAIGIGFAAPAIWGKLAPYQQSRILTFLEPNLDPKGAGYNALQSMIAVGSGQLFGRGLGRGTQSHLRFLPEHHTDFIFATLVEELGFLGGMVLLIGYFVLLWRMLRPVLRGLVDNVFPFVFSLGLFAMILSQVFIHVGMNMGLLPITGITLPFVSYGGSSILSLAISFGIWLSILKGRNA